MAKNKKEEDYQQKIGELTLDLQRTRADFENYRKRMETEKAMARAHGRVSAIEQLLPVIDNIERAISHMPKELEGDVWAEGVKNLVKHLEKSMIQLGVTRIEAKKGTPFNPEFHEAVQFDETDGEHEVIAEELQAGYMLGQDVIRHSMVKVTRQ